MKNFKTGDKVKVITDQHQNLYDEMFQIGDTFMVDNVNEGEESVQPVFHNYFYDFDTIELVNDEKNVGLDYEKEYERLRQECGELTVKVLMLKGIVLDLSTLLND